MKTVRYYITAIIVLVSVSSCNDFIDIEPVDVLSAERVFETENDFFTALNGAYVNLQDEGYYGQSFMVIADASSDNGTIPADAETSRSPHYFTLDLSSLNSAGGFWDTAYENIAAINLLLEFLEGMSFEESVTNRITGEAKFLRALTYFDLVRLFSADYNSTADHSNLGVPVVLTSEITEPERNTIGEVYELVLQELGEAITLLQENDRPQPVDQVYIASVEAATALRARVYLYMDEYELARDDANAVINSGLYTLAPYLVADGLGGFDLTQIDSWADRNPTTEAIFELEIDQDDGIYPGQDGLTGYYQKDAGNAVFGPNLDIINLYASDDVRRNWYVQDNGVWHVDKYPGQGGLPLQFTVPVLRLTEMYLIKAETCARLNDDAGAQQAINLIRQRANQSDITSTGVQLLSDILEERRRELAFEGHRYYDLKRLEQDIIRNDCNLAANCVVTTGDRLFHYPIPQNELDGNPNIVQEGY